MSNAELSRIVTTSMDVIGYSKEMIETRAQFVESQSSNVLRVMAELCPKIEMDIVCCGSKGEGIAKLLESDVDLMAIFRNFLCVDTGRTVKDLKVLQTISDCCPPGYTRLNPLDVGNDTPEDVLLGYSCIYDLTSGQVLVSSACMRNFYVLAKKVWPLDVYEGVQRKLKQQTGPSVPESISYNIPMLKKFKMPPPADFDFVLAMPYLPASILDGWKKRCRKWPKPYICREISETESFVVPVGHSNSESQNFEWRISFTSAERILVSNLSSVQLKLYILLKMVFKEIVKPNCDLISSYMIKNTVFWVAERNDLDMFTPEKLIDILLHCLSFLRECLYSNNIPNYMIPSRNLLLGKGTSLDKLRMKGILTDLLNSGGCVILELDKLRNFVSIIPHSPSIAMQYWEMRDRVEKSFIALNPMFSKLSSTLFLRPTLIYDVLFELYKEPHQFGFLFSLLDALNIDLFHVACHPEDFFTRIASLLS